MSSKHFGHFPLIFSHFSETKQYKITNGIPISTIIDTIFNVNSFDKPLKIVIESQNFIGFD